MPLAEGLGEFAFKATSVNLTDIGGGQVRVTVDVSGEVKSPIPGMHVGTLSVTSAAPGLPGPFTYTGVTFAQSGSVVRVSGEGLQIRTGAGHKSRLRGTATYTTDDPALANLNGIIAAVEAETDPVTMTLKGSACVWK